MNSNLVYYIKKYKELIIEESYDFIVDEMIDDLKEILLTESKDIDDNYLILETFYDIKNSNNIIDRLNELEDILTEGGGISISNIKINFMNKHEKIIQRDKKWLSKNKKKILGLSYDEIELEVLSDYKVTFEQLLNRHNIFDKLFVNSDNTENIGDKLRRFEDKNENLKNGLDNYFRTGTSRREIGLRKIKGEDAKMAVENMVAYCESFLAGKQFLEEKMNAIIVAINDASVKESLSPIETLRIILEKDDSLKEINDTAKELASASKTKPAKEEEPVEDKNVKDETKAKPEKQEQEENLDEEEHVDVTGEKEEESTEEEQPKEERGIQDRQIGVAVLLSVAEERYFDYINILKGLMEE